MLRVRNVHPGSRIQQQQQERRGKKMSSFLFCSLNLYKIANYFILKQVKKKIWANSLRNIPVTLFSQKFSLSCQKYGFVIFDPRSRIQGSKRHWIPDPEHCLLHKLYKLQISCQIYQVKFVKSLFFECCKESTLTYVKDYLDLLQVLVSLVHIQF